MNTHFSTRARARQRGAGMMETMIGILIGLLVVVVVYNLLAVAEGYKRMTTGNSDAQITGLLSSFVAGADAANGGNGLTSGYSDLINCHQDEANVKFTADNTLKPISVIITPGDVPTNRSDTFVSRQSGSPHVVWPVNLRPDGAGLTTVPPGGDITVQSPNGFATPAGVSLPTAAQPFWAIAMANDATGRCALIQITNSTPSAADPPPRKKGEVTLKQGALKTTIPFKAVPLNDTGTPSLLLNLGRTAQRIQYSVDDDLAGTPTYSLRTRDCLAITGCVGVAANPIAQNVVWMKVQYGIDTSARKPADQSLDGIVNCWTPADDSTCGNWAPENIVKAGDPLFPGSADLVPTLGAVNANALNRIVAVRIGIVVRSDEPDLSNPPNLALKSPRPTATYLFNCAANTDISCQNRIKVPEGAAPPAVMIDGWRYRTYEAIIPLRNSIFNATIAP